MILIVVGGDYPQLLWEGTIPTLSDGEGDWMV